jgi:S1-C subfamily serine protease
MTRRKPVYSSLRAPIPVPVSTANEERKDRPKLGARLKPLLDLAKRSSTLAVAALALALGLFAYQIFSPHPRKLAQRDIDASVEYSLSNRQAEPSPGAVSFATIRPSLVKVKRLSGPGPDAKEIGNGSGVVITETGDILTNFHVIEGAARLTVLFFDGSESEVAVASADPSRDLALLHALSIPDDLKPATIRSLGGVNVGDPVFAVGFPFGIGPSFSEGVVSGLDRAYVNPNQGNVVTGLIQFDAAANPGNSGGPLVDKDGAVLGIVTFILNPTEERVFIGIGFALPIESAAGGFAQNPF